MKLLYPFANVMGIHFPIGKIEESGTCQFATASCIEECCACHLDTGMGVERALKEELYGYFCNTYPEVIAENILRELITADCKILTWFASGDCPSTLTTKFFSIVHLLDMSKVIQTGITRNKELWKRCKELSDNSKVLLTIEEVNEEMESGLYSLPDYKCGAINIVTVGKGKVHFSAGCGGGYYEYKMKILGIDKAHLRLDCKACYKNKTGCFQITDKKED